MVGLEKYFKGRLHCVRFLLNPDGSVFPSVIARISTLQMQRRNRGWENGRENGRKNARGDGPLSDFTLTKLTSFTIIETYVIIVKA
jgi:hypothetical protein